MNESNEQTEQVAAHYSARATLYHEQYERDGLYDIRRVYPANYFRVQLLLNTFVNKGIKRVIEIGVGEGTPLLTLARAGIDVWGFDLSEEMVKISKEKMQQNQLDPTHIFWGDIQDPITYAHVLKEGQFDGLMAMGVMPHVENENQVINNMSTLVKPGGSVFIEFRNSLFSLFTMNRYTHDFIVDDLLQNVNPEMKKLVSDELKSRMAMDQPPRRNVVEESDAPGFDAILSKFHNPFEVVELFERKQFTDIKLLWYHYHPALPMLEKKNPELFRREAIRLEHEPSNWRGLFLCSAFVVEAVKA